MLYLSTRGHPDRKHFCEILLEGLAPDGGLYLPERYPQVSLETLARWRDLPYAELAFEIPAITREMTVVIQGLIILFSGALLNMPRPMLQWLAARLPAGAGDVQAHGPAVEPHRDEHAGEDFPLFHPMDRIRVCRLWL